MPTLWMFVDTAEGFIEIAQKKNLYGKHIMTVVGENWCPCFKNRSCGQATAAMILASCCYCCQTCASRLNRNDCGLQ